MRVDEKQVAGPDLERAAEQQKTLLAERREHAAFPVITGEQVRDHDPAHADRLLAAIDRILDREHLDITQLRMAPRETIALEALQAAVLGRTTHADTFVFASDRRSMLEQALAVLQPNLTGGDTVKVVALRGAFEQLTTRVGELRLHLMNLEDGQDELMAEQTFAARTANTGETAPTPREADEAADEAADAEAAAARPGSTLTGAERPAPAKGPTTLGTEADLANASNQPWWRMPVSRG